MCHEHQDAKGRATHSQRLSGILDSALKLENNASDLMLLLCCRGSVPGCVKNSRRMHRHTSFASERNRLTPAHRSLGSTTSESVHNSHLCHKLNDTRSAFATTCFQRFSSMSSKTPPNVGAMFPMIPKAPQCSTDWTFRAVLSNSQIVRSSAIAGCMHEQAKLCRCCFDARHSVARGSLIR